jgi:alpha-amylase/alpha-mannosidase (GH57 family)
MLFLSFRTTHINIVCEPERIGSLEYVSDTIANKFFYVQSGMITNQLFDLVKGQGM